MDGKSITPSSGKHRGAQHIDYQVPYQSAGLFRPGDEPTSSGMSPEVTVLDVPDHRPRRVPSKTWRELIKKACARAGGYLGSGPSQLSPLRP